MTRLEMTLATLGMLSASFVPSVRADEWNKETHLTINVPVQIQDTVLAPGEYVFKLVELAGSSTVVSIFNSNGTRLETMMISLPAYRNDIDNKLFTISDPQGDQPATLQSWFFPGDNFGIEFKTAKRTNETSHLSGTTGKGQNAGKADAAAPAGN